ncbi:MAG: hypothetical protein AAF689_17850 [Pseudomonadota bacterium]
MTVAKLTATALCLMATALPATAQSAVDIVELLCGRTVQYYSVTIGNQIEFTDPDGTAYLWHPFAAGGVVIGDWRIEVPDNADVQVCYTYPDGSFGPDTGGDHCFTYAGLIDDIVEDGIRDGDPFDLRTGVAPFPLPLNPPLPAARLSEMYPDQDRGPGCSAYVS